MQRELGTVDRAARFYDDQVRDRLNDRMREFIGRQEMFFLSSADRQGNCDATFRAGPPGFVQVFNDRTIAYPEYRGNGVLASLGNIKENPHVGILMIDFSRDRIGLHVNGRARQISDDLMRIRHPDLPVDPVPGRRPQIWVEVDIDEAYIHCSKHIPRLVKVSDLEADGERAWGTDDVKRKGGDFFGVAAATRAHRDGAPGPATTLPAAPPVPAPPQPVRLAAPAPAPTQPAAHPVRSSAPGPVQVAIPAQVSGPGVRGSRWSQVRPLRATRAALSAAARARSDAPGPAADGLPADPNVWRLEAERALERARQHALDRGEPRESAEVESGAFRGWFG